MLEKIKHFIEAHLIGLFGLLMFLFYLIINLLPKFVPRLAKYDLPLIDLTFIVLGTGLLIYSFIPKQVDYIVSRFRYWLIQIVDRLTPRYTLIIIFALTVIGFYLRFYNLGYKSFWIDEAITSSAAIGLLEHGTPVLPSGIDYTRALLNTYLIALSFKIFGISEFSARIVSVVFGTLTIPLVYLLGKELENKRIAIIAILLITFSLFEILWARSARMYAQFQFFYLLTAYLFYMSLKKDDVKLFLLSFISFIFAWYSHRLSLCFIPVAIIYLLLYKRKEFLKNKYFVYVSLGGLGLVFVYIIRTGKTPLDYMHLEVPIWAQKTILHYVVASNLFALMILMFIGIAISLILCKLNVHKSMCNSYTLFNFFIPFIILILYPWKNLRYIYFIFPFLVILASRAIDFYVIRNWGNNDNAITQKMSREFKVKNELVKNIQTAITVILILLLFIQVSSDFYSVSQGSCDFSTENWKKAGGFVKEHLNKDDRIAATVSLIALYYIGRVDYEICQYNCHEYINKEGILVDYYTGSTILNNYDLFLQKVNTGKGWLIADQGVMNRFIDPKVRDYIRDNMTYYLEGSDETIEVYSWGLN